MSRITLSIDNNEKSVDLRGDVYRSIEYDLGRMIHRACLAVDLDVWAVVHSIQTSADPGDK